MKKNHYLFPFMLSAALTAGVFQVSRHEIYQPREEKEESRMEADEAEGIQGALESIYSLRFNQITGELNPADMQAAVNAADRMAMYRLGKNFTWQNLGPNNQGGRTRAFLIDKSNPSRMFAGAVSGGLFISTDGGSQWKMVNDMQENLNVVSITQGGDNAIYYGTGEGAFTYLNGNKGGSPAFMGNGIYKSTDGGATFTLLASTKNKSDFITVSSMATSKDGNTIFAGTTSGFWYSSNGGTSWTRGRTGNCREIKVGPDGTIFANIGTQLWRIDDWTNTSGYNSMALGATNADRISIAISPEDGNYVYCMVANNTNALEGVYQTKNKGANWTKIHNGGSPYADPLCQSNTLSSCQGWYDNAIGVHPKNKEMVFMGGVQMAKWTPAEGFQFIGSLFDAAWNTQYVHADKHLITWNTYVNPPVMVVGTDGGLFFSYNDGATYTPKNNGYISLQAYNVAANWLGHVVGGSQDNGTQLVTGNGNTDIPGQPSKAAVEILGGDGFDVEFSRHDPKVVFASTYYGNVRRSSNNGQSQSAFWDKRITTDGRTWPQNKADFKTTFVLWEPQQSGFDSISRLFLAANNEIWMARGATDFGNTPDWFMVSNTIGGNTRVIDLEVTPDGNSLFVAKDGRLFRIDSLNKANFSVAMYPVANAIPAPITTTSIYSNLPSGRDVTSVAVDPSDPNHIVVTLGNYGNTAYIYESKNALSNVPTFTNITGNLPAMPVYDAIIYSYNSKFIAIGTDLGIWATENGGTTWEEQNTGMARVPVYEIRQYEFNPGAGPVVYIGTHGRGFFRSQGWATNVAPVKASVITSSMMAFPNPVSDVLNLKFEASMSGKADIEVISISGKSVMNRSFEMVKGNNNVSFSVAGLSPGIYFARTGSSVARFIVK